MDAIVMEGQDEFGSRVDRVAGAARSQGSRLVALPGHLYSGGNVDTGEGERAGGGQRVEQTRSRGQHQADWREHSNCAGSSDEGRSRLGGAPPSPGRVSGAAAAAGAAEAAAGLPALLAEVQQERARMEGQFSEHLALLSAQRDSTRDELRSLRVRFAFWAASALACALVCDERSTRSALHCKRSIEGRSTATT